MPEGKRRSKVAVNFSGGFERLSPYTFGGCGLYPRVFAMSEKKQKLRFGLPKGSLQEATIEKMGKAGFNIQVSSRSYVPYVDDSKRAMDEYTSEIFMGGKVS